MENVELDMDLSSLPKVKWMGGVSLIQFEGFWFVSSYIKPIQKVINHFNPLPSDVILASYPKTGTTWLKSLLYCILNRSSKHHLTIQHPHKLVHFLEELAFTDSEDFSIPTIEGTRRLFATHIPYQLLAKTLDRSGSRPRVVYVMRNPKDTLVSLCHFTKQRKGNDQPWTIDETADAFCRGATPFGPYYDHVTGYRHLTTSENLMFVTYEEMKEDPHGHVKKLGDFLGCPFQEDEEDEVEEIVKNCSFEVLSSHEVNQTEESLVNHLFPHKSYFRKGITGDYENYLSNDLIERIDTLTKHRFHSLGFMYGI